MTRQMLFTRKGDGKGDAPNAPPSDDAQADAEGAEGAEGADVTCPKCGCVFDPEMVEGGATDGADGGVDLELPAVTPAAQAPAGEDAITRAVAAALRG